MTSYRQTLGEDESQEVETKNPCRYCGAIVKNSMLAMLGARCHPCYERYVRLGYSGAAPAPQHKSAAWVAQAAADNAAKIAAREKAA